MNDCFTAEELAFGEQHPVLGPEYEAARNAAEKFMAPFEAEHFKALIDKFADDFRDKLWSDVADYLVADTETNLHETTRRAVEATVQALLTGEQWALNRYPLASFHDGEKIRKAVALHIGDEIALGRIADLEKEIAELKRRLEWASR